MIGDRYGFAPPSATPTHRLVANAVCRIFASQFGFDIPDITAGIVACDRKFASVFVKYSRSTRQAPGFDWIVLAFLHGLSLAHVPVHAKMRSDRTDAGKLARNLEWS